jgi:hypothetical protein
LPLNFTLIEASRAAPKIETGTAAPELLDARVLLSVEKSQARQFWSKFDLAEITLAYVQKLLYIAKQV